MTDLTEPQLRRYMDKRGKILYILQIALIKLLLLESFLTLYICMPIETFLSILYLRACARL